MSDQNESISESIPVTEDLVAEIFIDWDREVAEHPEEFGKIPEDKDRTVSAKYFMDKLRSITGKVKP